MKSPQNGLSVPNSEQARPVVASHLRQQALQVGPCCVCEKLHQEESAFLRHLALKCTQIEGATDDLINGEFCNLHAWQFSKSAAPAACGIIGRELLNKYLQTLNQIETSGQIQGALSQLAPRCLVCDFLKEQEEGVLSETVKTLESQPVTSIAEISRSLCRCHFGDLLGRVRSIELKSELILGQVQGAVVLMEAIEEILYSKALRPFAAENRIPPITFQKLFGRPYIKEA